MKLQFRLYLKDGGKAHNNIYVLYNISINWLCVDTQVLQT